MRHKLASLGGQLRACCRQCLRALERVIVPEGGLSDKGMDALGRALGQHPRIIFFAVVRLERGGQHTPCRLQKSIGPGAR